MVYCGGASGSIITLTGSAKWTWEKYNATYYYYWQRYNSVITGYSEVRGNTTHDTGWGSIDHSGLPGITAGSNCTLSYYTDYTFDSNSGTFSFNSKDRGSWDYRNFGEEESFSFSGRYWPSNYYGGSGNDRMGVPYKITWQGRRRPGESYKVICQKVDYYIYSSEANYGKGSTSYGRVNSTNSSAYPSNGRSGSYWYVSDGSEWVKGSFIQTVTADSDRAYPDDGVHTDNYWYVKI